MFVMKVRTWYINTLVDILNRYNEYLTNNKI